MADDRQLSDKQLIVIEALCAGHTQSSAATVAGVERHSVGRWLKEDSVFQHEYNARRYAMQSDNTERIRGMATAALDVVERALQSLDEAVQLRAAALILKTLGLDTVAPITDDDIDQEVLAERVQNAKIGRMLQKLRRMGPPKPDQE